MKTQLSKEDLLKAYRLMREARAFEERVHEEFATGNMPGFVHLGAGEEAAQVGAVMQLQKGDWLAANHRSHGECIAKGLDPIAMMAELWGKSTGVCKGKGGSMHIADLQHGILGANGIVGAGPPLASGAALAAKLKKTDRVSMVTFGDGASNQGLNFEAMNLAVTLNLPMIFLLINNGYAEATSVKYSAKVGTGNVADRARGFGMPAVTVDGNNFFAVYEAVAEAIERARKGGGPTYIECKTLRYYGHFEGDAQTYRPKDEVKNARKNDDPLKNFAKEVIGSGLIEAAELEAIDKATDALIDKAVKEAKAGPLPDASELLTDVYVSY